MGTYGERLTVDVDEMLYFADILAGVSSEKTVWLTKRYPTP